MTALRQRMREDLQLRNYSPQTIDCYLRCVANFAQHFATPPDRLGPEHIRQYQLYLVHERHVSWSLVMQTVCALRFFYNITLGQSRMLDYIPQPKRPKTLPTILSQAEVAALLQAPRRLKTRAILTTLYAAGLRSLSSVSSASRILTVAGWCCASGRGKASKTAASCCHHAYWTFCGSIGSAISHGRGSSQDRSLANHSRGARSIPCAGRLGARHDDANLSILTPSAMRLPVIYWRPAWICVASNSSWGIRVSARPAAISM